MTAIEWTQRPGTKGETWNPVVGCTPVSAGCLNCYAATMARRLEAMGKAEYLPTLDGMAATAEDFRQEIMVQQRAGYTYTAACQRVEERTVRIAEVKSGRAVFAGQVRTLPGRLADPLGWKRPRTVFVNSMSDLFHEAVPFEFIDRVFAVMALCPQHTFIVLTKRPERMAKYLILDDGEEVYAQACQLLHRRDESICGRLDHFAWPLPNVWLGTSVENQAAADERIPQLLRCRAAVRFLSCEPLLGEVRMLQEDAFNDGDGGGVAMAIAGDDWDMGQPGVDWVIAGGESGAQARACDVAWLRSIVRQCRVARVPVFVKQLGARPMMNYYEASRWYEERGWDILDHRIFDGADGREWVPERDGQPSPTALLDIQNRRDDRKGGDPAEWPEDLRVREWPGEQHTAHSTQHTRGGA